MWGNMYQNMSSDDDDNKDVKCDASHEFKEMTPTIWKAKLENYKSCMIMQNKEDECQLLMNEIINIIKELDAAENYKECFSNDEIRHYWIT